MEKKKDSRLYMKKSGEKFIEDNEKVNFYYNEDSKRTSFDASKDGIGYVSPRAAEVINQAIADGETAKDAVMKLAFCFVDTTDKEGKPTTFGMLYVPGTVNSTLIASW